MLDLLKNRRTVRRYTPQEIPESLLNDLLEAASRVATTGNMQLYSVVVTRCAEKKEKLAPAHFRQPALALAPVVLTFCADFNRFVKWCELRGAQPGYGNFQSFIAATFDALLFAQQFCTAAESQGLGTCYLGTTTYNAQPIIDALSLPRYVIPVITVTVGYPAAMPDRVERLPLEAVVHNEQYTDYTDQDIERLYAEKEQLPVNKQYVEENNKETLAQVFTDVRYTKKNNETFSALFLDVLQKQGFKMP